MNYSPNYDPERYELRRRANERSRAYAHRDNQPWTTEDDEILLEFWVKPGSRERDEAEVARAVQRTIESCRNRVHKLVGQNLGGHYVKVTETTTVHTVTWSREDDEEFPPEWYARG